MKRRKPNLGARFARQIVRAADAGQITTMAAVVLTSDGRVLTTWCGPPLAGPAIAGAAAILQGELAWNAAGARLTTKPLRKARSPLL